MKGYNFEENKDFDATVKLDKINEEVRKHEESAKKFVDEIEYGPSSTGKTDSYTRKEKPFRYFNIIILLVCIGAFLIVFAVAYRSLGKKASESKANFEETIKRDENEKDGYQNAVTSFSALIKSMPSAPSDALFVYDISSEISRSLYPEENLNLTGFARGDIVDVSANLYSSKIKTLEKNSDAFKLNSVTGLSYDSDEKSIIYENSKYSVLPETIFVINNEISDISDLDKTDVVNLSGLDNKVLYVSVEKVHGSMLIENANSVSEGKILLDGSLSFDLGENLLINLSPGMHKVDISGSNINDYSTEVFISSADTYKLDVSKIPQKTGVLSIKSNVEGFYVSVDGGSETLFDPSSPLVLHPGEHRISVSKEGYKSAETTVNIDDSYKELNVVLEKEIYEGVLSVTSSPNGSDVYVNDQYRGITPISLTLEYGKYKITVEKKGYRPLENKLDVNNENQSIECILTPIEED